MGTVYFPYLRNLVAVGCCILVYREWPRRKILSFIRTSLTWQWVLRLLMPNLICFRVRTSASVLSLSFLLKQSSTRWLMSVCFHTWDSATLSGHLPTQNRPWASLQVKSCHAIMCRKALTVPHNGIWMVTQPKSPYWLLIDHPIDSMDLSSHGIKS